MTKAVSSREFCFIKQCNYCANTGTFHSTMSKMAYFAPPPQNYKGQGVDTVLKMTSLKKSLPIGGI